MTMQQLIERVADGVKSDGMHNGCVRPALVRTGLGSGLPPGRIAREMVSGFEGLLRGDLDQGHQWPADPIDEGEAGRMIGNGQADGVICGYCAAKVLAMIDEAN